MSKYTILIFFILFSFSYVKENINPNTNINNPLSDEAEDITSYLIEFFSGMMGNVTNSRCIKNLQNQREKYTELISDILNLGGNVTFHNFTSIYGFKIIKMPGFLKDCQLAFLFKMYFMLTDTDKIKYIGNRVVNNTLEIYDSINKVRNGTESFFKCLGTIIRLSFDLKFK
jgi:hypothetical protein